MNRAASVSPPRLPSHLQQRAMKLILVLAVAMALAAAAEDKEDQAVAASEVMEDQDTQANGYFSQRAGFGQ